MPIAFGIYGGSKKALVFRIPNTNKPVFLLVKQGFFNLLLRRNSMTNYQTIKLLLVTFCPEPLIHNTQDEQFSTGRELLLRCYLEFNTGSLRRIFFVL
jgi:hypothetical protein